MSVRRVRSTASSRSSATPPALRSTTRPTSSLLLCSVLVSAVPCPAGRSVPGRGGPERRRHPRPDGTGPSRIEMALVRAGSARHREAAVPTGHERSRPVRRHRRSPHLPGQDLGEWLSEMAGSSPSSRLPRALRPLAHETVVTEDGPPPTAEPGAITNRNHRRSHRPCHPCAM